MFYILENCEPKLVDMVTWAKFCQEGKNVIISAVISGETNPIYFSAIFMGVNVKGDSPTKLFSIERYENNIHVGSVDTYETFEETLNAFHKVCKEELYAGILEAETIE